MQPSDIASAFSGMAQNLLPSLMKWIGIAVISAIILGAFYMIFISFQYNILVQKLMVVESTKKGKDKDGKEIDIKEYYVRGVGALRARRISVNGVEKFQYMFSNKHTDPVPERFVLPYNGLLMKFVTFVYDVGGNIQIPASLGLNVNSPAAINFTPLPYEVKRAASLELQEINREFMEDSFMAKYGQMMWGFFTVVACLVLAGTVIWLTYSYIGGGLKGVEMATNNLADSFKSGITERFSPS